MKKLFSLLSCLLLIGCGEKKVTDDNGAAGNDQGAGDPVANKSEEAPASPESKIIGYWTLDAEKSLKALEDLPVSTDSDEAKALKGFIGTLSESGLLINFSKGGKVEMYNKLDDPPKASTYTVITDDDGAISVDIEGQNTLALNGETLWSKVGKGDGRIGFTRVDATEAKRHIEEARSGDPKEVTEPAVPAGEDE